MSVPVKLSQFAKGLQTKRREEGGEDPDSFAVFQNVRVSDGGASRRAGSVQIAYCGTDQTAVDLNGTTQWFQVPLDIRIHTMPRYWTWQCHVNPDVVNATQYIWGNVGATSSHVVGITAAGLPFVTIWHSDNSSVTVTADAAVSADADLRIKVVRDLATLTLRVNTTSKTGVASSTLAGRAPGTHIAIGQSNSADFFNGQIDSIVAWGYVRGEGGTATENFSDSRLRFQNPREAGCLYSYTGELDAQTAMRDHGRYEAHARGQNTPTETTALTGAVQDAMVNGIHARRNKNGEREALIMSGGRLYRVPV